MHAQFGILLAETSAFDFGLQHTRELRDLERLDQEIDRAALDRRHRLRHGAEARHDDRDDLGVARQGEIEHLHALRSRESQVGDNRIECERLQPGDGVVPVDSLGDVESVPRERVGDQFAKVGFVVDYEDARCSRSHNWLSALTTILAQDVHRQAKIHENRRVADYPWRSEVAKSLANRMPHHPHTAFNVLVVDDEPEIRELLVEYFRDHGFETATAGDGRAAIAAIERDPARYRLIITDLQMPGADGLAVLRAARTANPSCYVVIITGYASLDSAIQAVRLGAYDYLTKPFSMGQIDVVVQRV